MNQRALFIPTQPQLEDFPSVPFDAVIGLTDAEWALREKAECAGAARVQRLGEDPSVLEPGKRRQRAEAFELLGDCL